MQLETLQFGVLEIPKKEIIYFPKGLLGFEQYKKYVIIEHQDTLPFRWLQSIEKPELAFVIVNPSVIFPDYHVEVNSKEVRDISVKNENDVEIMVIVTVPEDMSQMSANFQGPILLNNKNMKAKQFVLSDSEYGVQHYIYRELQRQNMKTDSSQQQIPELT